MVAWPSPDVMFTLLYPLDSVFEDVAATIEFAEVGAEPKLISIDEDAGKIKEDAGGVGEDSGLLGGTTIAVVIGLAPLWDDGDPG